MTSRMTVKSSTSPLSRISIAPKARRWHPVASRSAEDVRRVVAPVARAEIAAVAVVAPVARAVAADPAAEANKGQAITDEGPEQKTFQNRKARIFYPGLWLIGRIFRITAKRKRAFNPLSPYNRSRCMP